MGNGPMGSFWGILKRGPYYGRKPTGREQLGPMVRGHIAYYNSSPPSAGWASIRLWRPMPRCLTNACAVRQYITPAGIRCGFFIICLFYFPVCLTEAVYNFQTAERLLYFVWAHIYSATKTTVFLFFRWVAINHAVYHLHQRVHVPFFLRPLKYDIGPPARSKGGFPPSSRRGPPPCPPLWCWQSGC